MMRLIYCCCLLVVFGACHEAQKTKLVIAENLSVVDEINDTTSFETLGGDSIVAPIILTEKDTLLKKDKDGYYEINWKMLSLIEFDTRYNEEMQMDIMFPLFSPFVRQLNGQKVKIKGYIVPGLADDLGGKVHILSMNPNASCFFCGGAGPESVIDVLLINPDTDYKVDDLVTFKGIFNLNDSDINYLNYVLKEASEVEKH